MASAVVIVAVAAAAPAAATAEGKQTLLMRAVCGSRASYREIARHTGTRKPSSHIRRRHTHTNTHTRMHTHAVHTLTHTNTHRLGRQ